MEDFKKMYRTIMDDHFPEELKISFGEQTLVYQKKTWKIADEATGELIEKGLRYGENPGQEAALYELTNGNLVLGECRFIEPGEGLVSRITETEMLQSGKHPGKINFTDIDNALNILKFLMNRPAICIMKHTNPCGVAYGDTLAEAYDKANMADRIAAFGGCVASNRPIDKTTAELMAQNYLEVIAAPEFESGTVEILKTRKNLRIICIPRLDKLAHYRHKRYVDIKSLMDGGIIVQQSPLNAISGKEDFKPAHAIYKGNPYDIKRMPTKKEYDDFLFGWSVEQGVTSNSVLFVKDGVTVAIGTGEQDRVGVAEIAVFKGYTKYADALCFKTLGIPFKTLEEEIARGKRKPDSKGVIEAEVKKNNAGLIGSVMVSDAFFPFRDGVDVGIAQGITGIVQPGGSERDFESIEACNQATPPVTMVFTGQRAFKH